MDTDDDNSTEVDETGLPPIPAYDDYVTGDGVYTEPIPLDADIFTPVGLAVDFKRIEYAEWARLGSNLDRINRSHRWWIGDWHNGGEDKWGEEIWQILDEFAANTVRNWGIVCAAFPIEDRIGDGRVDFTHFRIAADLKTLPSRRACMRQVVEGDWNTRETQAYVDEKLGRNQPDDDPEEAKSKGETNSITWTMGFNLAPADEADGDKVAAEAIDHIEKLLASVGVAPRGINAPNKTFNES